MERNNNRDRWAADSCHAHLSRKPEPLGAIQRSPLGGISPPVPQRGKAPGNFRSGLLRLVLPSFSRYGWLHERSNPEELADSLSFALLFNGRKRYREADELMAKIVAEHLVEHLQRSGYVLMKNPPGPGHSTGQFSQKPAK